MTVIAMGYFKALEQYMYKFIGLHTSEKDGKRREFPFPSSNSKSENWLQFTDENYNRRRNNISLGSMAKFLKNRKNLDLLRDCINSNTIDLLRDVLSKATSERNGYFHKDNIDNWEKVESARKLTFVLFYILLGAYKYHENEKIDFGIIDTYCPSEKEKVCSYIHQLAISHDPLNIPILYFSKDATDFEFYFALEDKQKTYNEYGEPQYSGICIKVPGKERAEHYISIDKLPNEIFEGNLEITRDMKLIPSGPQKLLYENGIFMLK